MTRWTLAMAATGALLLSPLALGSFSGTTSRGIYQIRTYTAEVPTSDDRTGSFTRLGVILPPDSKVIKVDAYMDDKNHGKRVGRWKTCNLESGQCRIGEARVTGLRRENSSDAVQITTDFWNLRDGEPRYAKLRVTFLPIGNPRRKYSLAECRLRVECGFSVDLEGGFGDGAPGPREREIN